MNALLNNNFRLESKETPLEIKMTTYAIAQ